METPKLPEIVSVDFKNEWRDMPEEDYHRDLSAVARGDVLSMMVSPQSFLARRRKEENKEEISDAMRIGRAAHMMALEPQKFRSTYRLMPDFGDMRSSKNRETRDAFLSDLPPGSEAITEEELTHLTGMCNALLMHPEARSMFEEGILEKCGYYRDPVTGLKCRIKPDCVNTTVNGLFDFKTARDSSAKKFAASVWENRYDIQLIKYAWGTKQILKVEPDILGWVVVEKTPPYEPAVYIASGEMLEIGTKHYRAAMGKIAGCVDGTLPWEYRQKTSENIGFPNWVYYQEENLQ